MNDNTETIVRDELCRYPRDNNGNRLGCLYAVRTGEKTVSIGWSSYNAKKETRCFSKKIARDIAKGRAVCGFTANQIPYELMKHVTTFIESVNRVMGKPLGIHVVTRVNNPLDNYEY